MLMRECCESEVNTFHRLNCPRLSGAPVPPQAPCGGCGTTPGVPHGRLCPVEAALNTTTKPHGKFSAYVDPSVVERREALLIERVQKLEGELKHVGEEMVEQTSRALRARELLARALPMLADLVPKFPDAAKLCEEIQKTTTPQLTPGTAEWSTLVEPR